MQQVAQIRSRLWKGRWQWQFDWFLNGAQRQSSTAGEPVGNKQEKGEAEAEQPGAERKCPTCRQPPDGAAGSCHTAAETEFT